MLKMTSNRNKNIILGNYKCVINFEFDQLILRKIDVLLGIFLDKLGLIRI